VSDYGVAACMSLCNEMMVCYLQERIDRGLLILTSGRPLADPSEAWQDGCVWSQEQLLYTLRPPGGQVIRPAANSSANRSMLSILA